MVADKQFNLAFGVHPEATDSFDVGIDTLTAPFGFSCYSFFNIPQLPNFLKADIRKTNIAHIWHLTILNTDSAICRLTWDVSQFSSAATDSLDSLILDDVIDMSQQDSAVFIGDQVLKIYYAHKTTSYVKGRELFLPQNYCLKQNYPNPFNLLTTIRYYLQRSELVHLTIYDASGRLVKNLVNDEQRAGLHLVVWDGRNGNAELVANGTYFYSLKVGNNVLFYRKMIMIK